MRPKSHHAIIVAAIVVGVAAALGIAAIEGWLPWWRTPRSEERRVGKECRL